MIRCSRKKAHQVYKLKSGDVVPGGSTIAKIADPQDGLMKWHYSLGQKGLDPEEYMREAGGMGTVAHFMIQCHFNGDIGDFREFSRVEIDKGQMLYEKFLREWEYHNLEFVASELQLVSETYRYGGTLDIVFRKNGTLGLLDVKSSPNIYTSMIRQVASYENLWNENNEEKIEQRVIFRLDKKSPTKTDIRWLGDLSNHFNAFLKRLAVYYADKET